MQLIKVDCPLCGCSVSKPGRRLNDHTLVRCRACGFCYADPRPTEAAILRAYTQASKSEELSFAYAYEKGEAGVDGDYSWTGTYVLERFLRRRPGGSFLDIGAGQGWAVLQALDRGHEAWGYEFGDERAFESDPRLQGRIFASEAALEATGIKFDLIYLSAVLEHVYRPVDFLNYWKRFLKPGGFFCVAALPNLDSIFIRLRLDSWDGNIPFNHLNYFSPVTLRRLISGIGGRTLELYTMGAPVSVSICNIFRQRQYAGPFWGDHADRWRFAQKTQRQFARVQESSMLTAMTGLANRIIRLTGAGSNIYATFVINEDGTS